jgi:vitamin B12 transporter
VAARWGTTSGLLGLGYRLTEAWRLTASVATGFRAPSVGELANNVDLKPETHQSQEVGVAYASAGHTFRAVAFHTRTSDAIYWQPVAPWTPVNIGKVRNQGLEVGGTTQWRNTNVRYALVTQDPWNESDNTRLARRARQYGSLDVWRTFGVTTAGVKLHASGDRLDNAAPDRTLPAYSTLALYASQALDRDWTVRVKVENALDRPYQLAYGYNTPPFGMWVTLAYQQH